MNNNSFEIKQQKEWTCGFKKHLEKPWSQVFKEDPQYVHWVLTQPWVDDKLKGYIVKQPFYDCAPTEI